MMISACDFCHFVIGETADVASHVAAKFFKETAPVNYNISRLFLLTELTQVVIP